jgi:hypothetical protein
VPDAESEFSTVLGFTSKWYALGIANQTFLHRARVKWDNGEDSHAEHYRYWAFQEFLRSNRPISPSLAMSLFDLGASDVDHSMGGSMMLDIVRLLECPEEVLAIAEASERPHLRKAVLQRRTKPKV